MKRLKYYFFYFTIFVSGAVVLIVEILGTRVLAPFYGSTIYVWSSLISVTLAFLALGYWFGGGLADKRPNIDLLYWIVFIGGLAILLIPSYDKFILIQTDRFGLRYGPLISAFIIFAPSLFLFGTISPFAVKMRARTLDHLGVTAGNLYAIATFGSLAGGLLAGFYLIPNFSIKFIINLISLCLFFLFLIWQILISLKEE